MAASLASRAAPFEPWTKRSSLRVDITLKDQPASGICSYTTLDTIEGEATFTADVDTRFEQVSISFVGMYKVKNIYIAGERNTMIS